MRYLVVLVLIQALSSTASAQVRPGAMVQVYPAGQTGAFQISSPLGSANEIGVHAGYNRTRRRDWGIHDDERGGGPGFGASLKRFINSESRNWFYGLRVDLWSLGIDWYDRVLECSGSATACMVMDESRILVFQPTVQAGYRFRPAGYRVDLSLAFGREVNIRTRGAEVGDGAILLAGIAFVF